MTELKRLREKRNVSQREFAVQFGISTVHACKVECGRVCPSFDLALRISGWLGVPIGKLWELTDSGIRAIPR